MESDAQSFDRLVIHRVEGLASPHLIRQLVHVFRNARRGRLQFLLDLHYGKKTHASSSNGLLPENEVWLAESDDRPVGFIAFRDGWVKALRRFSFSAARSW